MPSSSHGRRSRVESTSSNHPTLRCVRPHTLVWAMASPPDATERTSTGMTEAFS